MKLKDKIASNVFYFFLDYSVLTISGYLFWIIMGKMLPPEEYGVVTTVVSLFMILLPVVCFGLFEALPKFIPELLKKGKKKEAKSLIKFSIKLSLFLSIIFSVFIFTFADKLSLYMYNTNAMTVPLQAFSIFLFVGVFSYVLRAVLQGLQRFKEMLIGDIIGNVFRIILAVVLVLLAFGAVGGVIAWSVWFLALIPTYLFVILKLKLTKSDNFDKKKLYKFCAFTVPSALSFFIILQVGVILLGILSTIEAAAFYGVAIVFGQFILFLPLVLHGSLFPSISELWVEQREKVKKLLSLTVKFLTIVWFPMVIIISLFSAQLVTIIYTIEYIPAATLVPLYVTGAFLFGITYIFLITLYAANRPKTRAVISVTGIFLIIILSILLIPTFNATGAVYAFFITQIVIFVLSSLALNRIIKFKISLRSFLIIPLNLMLLLILILAASTDVLFLQLFAIIIALTLYFTLLFPLKIINRKDKLFLDTLPDKFGISIAKGVIRKMIRLFERKA